MATRRAAKKTVKRDVGRAVTRAKAKGVPASKPVVLAVAVGPFEETPQVKATDLGGAKALRPIIKGLVDGLRQNWGQQLGTTYSIHHWQDSPAQLNANMSNKLSQVKPAAILTVATSALTAARAATTTVPIVFTIISDPFQDGGIQSITQSGSNVTGVRSGLADASPVCLQKFLAMVPGLRNVYALHRPGFTPAALAIPKIQAALPAGVQFFPTPIQDLNDLNRHLNDPQWPGTPNAGLLVIPDDLVVSQWAATAKSLQSRGVPTFFPVLHPVDPGFGPPGHACPIGAYGIPGEATGMDAAEYVYRVALKSPRENPGGLPIKPAAGFQWWVNKGSAHQLGIDITPVLNQVDRRFP